MAFEENRKNCRLFRKKLNLAIRVLIKLYTLGHSPIDDDRCDLRSLPIYRASSTTAQDIQKPNNAVILPTLPGQPEHVEQPSIDNLNHCVCHCF